MAGEGRVGGPANFNTRTKPHLQVNAAAHSPLPAPAPFVRPRPLLAPDGREMLISGAPHPGLIAPLQMGRKSALRADERCLAWLLLGLQVGLGP